MLHYSVDDLNSMYIEKILHHINNRVYDWDHNERSRIYYGQIIKSTAIKPFNFDLRSPEFAKFTAMVIYIVNTEFKSPRTTFFELPFLINFLFRNALLMLSTQQLNSIENYVSQNLDLDYVEINKMSINDVSWLVTRLL
jgi:hypothetical protein